MQTSPPLRRARMKRMLAITSSFCWSSPCTLLAAVGPGNVDEAGAVDFAVHDLGGQGNVAQQLRQLAGGVGEIFLLAHDEAVEGGADGQGQFVVVHKR